MKKALFISSRPIYPIICGGQIRTEQQLEFLSRHFDVDVLFLSDIKQPDCAGYLKFSKSAKAFYRSKIKCIIGAAKFLFNRLPLQVNYYLDRRMQSYVNKVASQYDVVFCNNIRTAQYARKLTGITKVLDFVDAISMNYDKARHHSLGLKKIIYEVDYRRCRDYERKMLKEFDSCSTISEIDKEFIEGNKGAITVVNNYVEIPTEEVLARHSVDNAIIFLGKMDYEPNVTAVTFFANEVLPTLRQRYNNLRFIIVGARPSKEVLELSKIQGVEVTGFVESTEPYFQDATVVVAPMLTGAGIQNKIIQAMSYGCCVATTPIGAEGLTLKGDELAIFNSVEEWIDGLIALLADREKRVRLGSNARTTILETLSREIVHNQFATMIEKVIKKMTAITPPHFNRL